MSTQRVPAGVPTGGRFTASARTEALVTLSDPPDGPVLDEHTVFVMPIEEFAERFAPGEYQQSGAGWDEVGDHPAFLEPNAMNPERIHAGTWDDFVADVARNGLREPVEIDPYSEEVCAGHHRIVAALETGQPVRFTVEAPEGSPHYADAQALIRSLLDEGVITEPRPGPVPDTSDPAPPPGSGWERQVSEYTGLVSYRRDFAVRDGMATHAVNGTVPGEEPQRDGEAVVLGGGAITIEQKGRYPGEMHYRVLNAPLLDFDGNDNGQRVKAVYINWVEVERNRGKGWASEMYHAVREAHPDCIVPAAANLEAPGKRLVKHYRGKYPEVHTGRFDSDCRIHPTTGPDDPTYRAEMLRGRSWQD